MGWRGVGAFVLLASACGEPGQAPQQTDGAPAIATYDVLSALPRCTILRRGEVFYVSSEDQFYYCDGSEMQELDMPAAPGWLVALGQADPSDCPDGGVLVLTGPDGDEDGVLDAEEVAATEAVCDGARGPAGPQGEPGGSCSVVDNGDGTKTIRCPGGGTVTVSDGTDGEDGEDGVAGTPRIRVDVEPPGANCFLGGHVVHVGLDTDLDGELDAGEVTSSDYACNTVSMLEGSVVFDEQSEVDLLSGLVWVTGSVVFEGNLDLAVLSTLQRIDGNVVISNNASLANLDMLGGLTSVAGHLQLLGTGITEVDGLAGLTSVGNLTLVNNQALTNLDGLSNLSSVLSFFLHDNDALLSANLGNLTTVAASLAVSSNDALASVDLSGLVSSGFVSITNNDALANVTMSGATGTLSVMTNGALTNLDLSGLTSSLNVNVTNNDALANLTMSGTAGSLILEDNDAPASFDLSGVSSAFSVEIENNLGLTSVDLGGLSNAIDNIHILSNPGLTSLDLGGLGSALGVSIHDNDALTDLSLSGVLRFLGVTENAALPDLDGLSGVTGAVILHFDHNDALSSIAGLSGITSLDSLEISGNGNLASLAGLHNLTSVRNFRLVESGVVTLDGLSQLTSVATSLFIINNPVLTSVSGMVALENVGSLVIFSNPNLPQCDVDALIGNIDVIGSVSTFGNTGSGGCSP